MDNQEKVVKVIKPFSIHVFLQKWHVHPLSFKAEDKDGTLMINVQEKGKMAILQFLLNMKGLSIRKNSRKIL